MNQSHSITEGFGYSAGNAHPENMEIRGIPTGTGNCRQRMPNKKLMGDENKATSEILGDQNKAQNNADTSKVCGKIQTMSEKSAKPRYLKKFSSERECLTQKKFQKVANSVEKIPSFCSRHRSRILV